ncbi:hypothetical protein QYE76_021525 [Lolium multiflorum]|uniref:MOB kinase activator-like 1A n=1 Tax=Lolium multiflorum TaxID=4521 RepID=A0AAD8VT49_LOLMU|nr:hypothetical protein QYE76_021525 [Lolium multiflorum]
MENYSSSWETMLMKMAVVSMEEPSGALPAPARVPEQRLLSPRSWLRDGGGFGRQTAEYNVWAGGRTHETRGPDLDPSPESRVPDHGNQKTFRPKKSAPSGSKGAQLRKHIDATLGSGNLREAVRLPPGEDINEWLAVNTVDFFNQVNLLYGTLTEFCTSESCPTMTAGPKYEYRWADGVLIKKPIEVSAPKYVEYLMDWIEGQLDNESLFPQKLGTPFPPNFKDVVNTIFKRLFRVYAHIYHSHFQKIVSLKEEAHLNTCFKHFILFTNEFGLIDKKELAPLQELIESIIVPY